MEIIFYGMACFQRIGKGFRVLFPDGTERGHIAGVWVRQRKKTATARWPWISVANDYFFPKTATFEVSGTRKTKLDTRNFDDRLVDLKKCDPEFEIAPNPQVSGILGHVDRGTLSAHVINTDGQIVVKWIVERALFSKIRLQFGEHVIEPSKNVDQVVLANVKITGINPGKFQEFAGARVPSGPQVDSNGFVVFDVFDDSDFQIYRQISTEPNKPLDFVGPLKQAIKGGAVVIEPDDFFQWETPNVKCSPTAYS